VATEIGAFEAKTHFSELIGRAERGEVTTVTKHGRPVARIVPFGQVKRRWVSGAALREAPAVSAQDAGRWREETDRLRDSDRSLSDPWEQVGQ
jgi:prevent-host-death family protein